MTLDHASIKRWREVYLRVHGKIAPKVEANGSGWFRIEPHRNFYRAKDFERFADRLEGKLA